MKRIFKIMFLAIIAFTLFAFCACACGDSENKKPEESADNIVIINGFNDWWDVATKFYLDPQVFYGAMTVNTDAQYIVEGDASYKFTVTGTGANSPRFEMLAGGVKSNITDVKEFGLYVYSDAEYEFSVIISVLGSADNTVFINKQTVKIGENRLVFPVNRSAIQITGEAVNKYVIAFSGLKGGTELYLDNFYAATTTEKVETKAEITQLITDISNMDRTSRTLVEGLFARYKALGYEDRLGVSNYSALKSAMDKFWLEDLNDAKTADKNILLFFGSPFAEVQIKSGTDGISDCSYVTDKKFDGETGSMRVTLTETSTNWVNFATTANISIDNDPTIQFTVYNESEQIKALCVGWNGPDDSDEPYYIIEPNSTITVICKSSDLTKSGIMQICGLSDMELQRACAPEGRLYFSSVQVGNVVSYYNGDVLFATEVVGYGRNAKADKIPEKAEYWNTIYTFDKWVTENGGNVEADLNNIIAATEVYASYNAVSKYAAEAAAERTGSDANTLFLFDRTLGLKQVRSNEFTDISINSAVKPSGENAVLKLSVNNLASGNLEYDVMNYDFNDDDYVMFYVYNGTNADYIDIGLLRGTSTTSTLRFRLDKNEWCMVAWSASSIKANDKISMYSRNYGDDYAAVVDANMTGDIYITKARVISSDNYAALSSVSDDYEYTLGNTTFKGATTWWRPSESGYTGNEYYNPDVNTFNSPLINEPYYMDGVLRAQINGPWPADPGTTAIIMKLKTPVAFADNIMYITMKGAMEDVHLQAFNTEGDHIGTPHAIERTAMQDGYYRYAFNLNNYASDGNLSYFRLYVIENIKLPRIAEVLIKDFAFTSFSSIVAEKRAGYDTDVIGLFDDPLGVAQVSAWDGSGFVGSYTTEKHIEGETGSLKITYSDAVEPSAIQISDRYGYTLESDKYVVFYMYNDTNAKRIDIALGTTSRVCVYRGEWTMICYESAAMKDNNFALRFYGYLFDDSATTFTGSIYLSRVKVLNSEKVQNATENADYTIGHTTFTGGITYYGNGDYGDDERFVGSPFYSDPYMVDGVLRTILRSNDNGTSTTPMIVLRLKDAVKCYDDTELYITMKGADTAASSVGAQIFCNNSHKGTPSATVVATLADGYYVYRFDLSGFKDEAPITYFRLFPIDSLTDWTMAEVRISDINITSPSSVAAEQRAAEKRAGYDTDVIGLFDDPLGVAQVSVWDGSGFIGSYTTEKHIEGETGSLEITYSDAVEPSAIQISDRYGYTLESGKYVVFYMYNDTNAQRVDIALGTTSRVCVYRGEWTMICYESAAMNDNNFVLRFYGYLFDNGASTFTGSIYLSRVKVLNSEKVQDATADADYTIGHTTFTGGITYYGNGDYGDVGTGRGFENSPFYSYPYMVDGVLRTIIRSGDSGESTSPMIRFELKDEVQCQDGTALYITMKGADTAASSVEAQIFCNNSHKGTRGATVVETLADGYYVYKFDLSGFKDEEPITYFRLYPSPNPRCLDSDWWMAEIRISDISISSGS